MFAECGQVIDWNDLNETSAHPWETCGCVEGIEGFESTHYAGPCYNFDRYAGETDAERDFRDFVGY